MAAKSRWKILSKAIKEKCVAEESESTKRKFQSYGILRLSVDSEDEVGTWYRVSLPEDSDNRNKSDKSRTYLCNDKANTISSDSTLSDRDKSSDSSEHQSELVRNSVQFSNCDKEIALREVYIRLQKPRVTMTQLTGFNNTGNVCIWPSEECLALVLARNMDLVPRSGNILELGGGQTCLAALLLARLDPDNLKVWLTDGNQDSVSNLEAICAKNPELPLRSGLYRWTQDENPAVDGYKFDLILCADCLFFDEGRDLLARKIHELLKIGGKALLMAPERSGTFAKFLQIARPLFETAVVENYDTEVWEKHSKLVGDQTYQSDIHFPKLIILTNKS